jgi:hypothetical protein
VKSAYKFIAGNSYVTPAGIAVAAVLTLVLHRTLGWWSAPLDLGLLLVTLALSTGEPPS